MKEDQTSDQDSLALSKNKPKFKQDPKAKEDFSRDVIKNLEQMAPTGWSPLEKDSSPVAKDSKSSSSPSNQDSDQDSLALSRNTPKFKEDSKEKENFGRDVIKGLEQMAPNGWLALGSDSSPSAKGSIASSTSKDNYK